MSHLIAISARCYRSRYVAGLRCSLYANPPFSDGCRQGLVTSALFRHSLLNLPLKDSIELFCRGLARPRKIQRDTFLVSPDIEIAGDELRSLVDAGRLGIANGFADPLQGQHDIIALTEAGIDGWREAAESVHDRKHADVAAGGELVVNEVYCPSSLIWRASVRSSRSLALTRRFGVLLRNCSLTSIKTIDARR
jgi:hypothetical protein